MVNRYYICDNCDYHFMIEQPIDAKLRKRCPSCKKHKLYQDLAGIYGHVVGEPSTLGQLAERNTKTMGKYELQEARKKQKEDKKKANREMIKRMSPDAKFPDKPKEKPWFGELPAEKKKELHRETTTQNEKKDKLNKIEKYIYTGE